MRFSAEFQCVYTTESSIPVVCGAKPGESRDGTENKRPSVILRLAMPDEELWNIAKSYGTTVRQIMQANGLESENRSESTMLLIPGRAK